MQPQDSILHWVQACLSVDIVSLYEIRGLSYTDFTLIFKVASYKDFTLSLTQFFHLTTKQGAKFHILTLKTFSTKASTHDVLGFRKTV